MSVYFTNFIDLIERYHKEEDYIQQFPYKKGTARTNLKSYIVVE